MHQKLISNPLYQKAPNCQTQTTHFFPCKILCHTGMAAASTPGNKQTAASPVHQRVVLGVEQATHASIEQTLFYSFPTTQPSCQSSKSAHVLRASKANTSDTEKQVTANTQDNIQLGYTGALAVSQPCPVPLGHHCRHYCQKRFPQKEFQHKIAKEKLPPNLPQPPQCKLTYKLCRSEKPTMCSCV